MNQRDNIGLLHEQLSRFRIDGGSVRANDSGYGRIQTKDAQGRSMSSGSVLSDLEGPKTGKITRSLPGSNLTSPSHGVAVPKDCFVSPLQPEYPSFERGNIVAASKFANVDNRGYYGAPQRPDASLYHNLSPSHRKTAVPQTRSDGFYPSGKPPSYYKQPSPPRSGTNSPRVYENIEQYVRGLGSPRSSLSSQDSKSSSPRSSVADGSYSTGYKQAEPQVPSGSRYASYPPYESPPMYENVQDLHLNNHTPVPPYTCQPGPQVASGNMQMSHASPSRKPYYPTAVDAPYNMSTRPGSSQSVPVDVYNQTMAARAVPSQCIALDVPKLAPPPPPAAQVCMPLVSKVKPLIGQPATGKNLLPYNVTPPRHMGPTEAEKKIEELTRQLEEEMEKQEDEGEYFGMAFIP